MDSSKEIEELRHGIEEIKAMLDKLEQRLEEFSRNVEEASGGPAEQLDLGHEDFLPDISEASSGPSEEGARSVWEQENGTEDHVGSTPVSEEDSKSEDTDSLFEEKTRQEPRRKKAVKAVLDMKPDRPSWYSDIPGPEVKDIRSAISLNDRVMFINSLFREDYALFQDTVNHVNAMTDFAQVVDYLKATFPEWNMNSDSVYRFMMAVRRKIR